ncbi:MAG: hypothetical protein ACKVU4_13530 [Phycisphaerales bacterium]
MAKGPLKSDENKEARLVRPGFAGCYVSLAGPAYPERAVVVVVLRVAGLMTQP